MTGSSATLQTVKRSSQSVDFVVLSYPDADYLINRVELISSHYCGAFNEKINGDGAVRAMDFNRYTLVLVSLDEYLKRYFKEAVSCAEGMILLVRGKTGDGAFPIVKRKSDGCDIDTSVIAMFSSGNATMESVPIDDLRLLPHRIGKYLTRYGLLAIRFLPKGRIQYFIDLRKIVIMSIVEFHNRQARNESSHS